MEFIPTDLPIESEYPKLVRDNIPDIIKTKSGKNPETRKLESDSEYETYLLKKMIEESVELAHSSEHGNMQEELADVLELVQELIKLKGWSLEDVIAVQDEKREKNGGFEQRTLLVQK